MKKINKYILTFIIILGLSTTLIYAQCTGGSLYPSTAGTPSTTFGSIATNSYAGQYTTWNVTKGYTYTWSTVTADGGSATYDTQLTLLDNSGNLLGVYNDNISGATTSRITWTATFTGVVRVLLTQFNCATNSTNTTVVAKRNSIASAPSCASIYVSPAGIGNGYDPSTPCNLQTAFAILAAYPSNVKLVKLLNGAYTYNQTIPMFAGVVFDGGYESLTDNSCAPASTYWRESSAQSTTITITPAGMQGTVANPYNRAVLADGISNWGLTDISITLVSTTTTSGSFETYALPNATNFGQAGATQYGLHIINGCTNYNLSRCIITTGSAGAGAAGTTPSGSGSAGGGGAGGAGGAGSNTSCGGSGGSSSVGSAGNFPGASTTAAVGGCGGSGCILGCNASGCTASGGNTGASASSNITTVNVNTTNYVAGLPAAAVLSNIALYSPITGATGGNGFGGSGGSGGGGGDIGTCCLCSCGGGTPNGGNGGSGGGGGVGGNGGYGGGANFAVYRHGTEAGVSINDITLIVGANGAGGAGAVGQAGNLGSAGASGVNHGGCDGGVGGNGGAGGNGSAGGRGQDGANGLSAQMVIAGVSSSPSVTISNPQTVTSDQRDGCTNSIITITKSSGTFTLPTGAAIVNDVTSSSSSTNVNSNAAYIYFPSTPSPINQNIVVTGTGAGTWRNYLQINTTRTLPTIQVQDASTSNVVSSVCVGAVIKFTSNIAGASCYEWTIQPTPVTGLNTPAAVFTSTSQNTANYTTTTSGTYQVRFRIKENCCGWSIPVYTTFTVAAQPVAQTITGSPVSGSSVCAGTNISASFSGGSGGVTGTTTDSYELSTNGGSSWTTYTAGSTISTTGLNGANVVQIRTRRTSTGTNCNASSYNTATWTVVPVVVLNPSGTNLPCYGGNTGSATVSAGGGTGAYTYSWYSGGNTNSISSLTAGTYTVLVTSGVCSSTTSYTVTQPTAIAGSASAGTIACYGGTTTLTVTASGGTGTLQYSLNGGTYQSGNTFTVNAGTQTVTVKDANNCTKVLTAVNVTQPAVISGSASAGTIACNGGTTTLTVTASGGTGTLQYSLNGGTYQSGNTFTVNAGTQTVTVKDANNCTQTLTAVNVTQPAIISGSASAGTIACNGGTTTLTVTASGGTGALQYSLNGGAYQSGNTFIVNAGTQTITVKDANNCTKVLTAVNVTQPTILVGNSCITANDLCQVGTGAVKVVASGGTSPYTVTWTPLTGTATPSNTISTSGGNIVIINLAGGTTLNITITDANGCHVP